MDLTELEKSIGYTLSKEIFDDISFRSVFQSDEKALSEKNKFYVDWGHAIIGCAYAVYYYLTERQYVNVKHLKSNIQNICNAVEEDVFHKYKLKLDTYKND